MKQRRADPLWCEDPGRIEGIQPNLSVLASLVKTPASLLDVGCSIGYVGDWLVRHVPGIEYAGIDIDAGSISEARRLHPGWRFARTYFEDWRERADYVFAARVLNHMPNPDQAVGQLMALAKRQVIAAVRFDHEEPGFTRISRDQALGWTQHARIVPSGGGPGCRYHTVIL